MDHGQSIASQKETRRNTGLIDETRFQLCSQHLRVSTMGSVPREVSDAGWLNSASRFREIPWLRMGNEPKFTIMVRTAMKKRFALYSCCVIWSQWMEVLQPPPCGTGIEKKRSHDAFISK